MDGLDSIGLDWTRLTGLDGWTDGQTDRDIRYILARYIRQINMRQIDQIDVSKK